MSQRKLLAALSAAVGLACATGCGDDGPGGAAAGAKKAGTEKAAIAASVDGGVMPGLATSPYAYNPLGKRDPFRAYQDERGPGTPEQATGCNEPLCQWDLDQMALVAVVSGDSNPMAMVEDPTHTGHLIYQGTKIGKQGGKVTQILRECLIVTEYWTGPDGKVNANPVKVCIAEEKKTAAAPLLDLMNPQKRY